MNDKFVYKAAPAHTTKGKNLLFSLVFCVLAVMIVGGVVLAAGRLLRPAAGASGAPGAANNAPAGVTQSEAQLQQTLPQPGDAYGTLRISGTSVDCTLYYGDADEQLNAGAGTYMPTCLPGQGGTILIAGHTATYFRDLESVQEGADIEISTNYGEFHYTVTGMKTALASDTSAYDLTATPENVILYTCYPFGQTEPTEWRYFVYGSLVQQQEAAANEQ